MDTIVSLAVISERLQYLPDVLERLLAQTVTPSRVCVWISEEPFLLDEGVAVEDLPPSVVEWAADETSPVEIRTVDNVGPHRKLVPLLRELFDEADPPLVVTADDDTLYPERWLEALQSAYRRNRCAVTFRARRIQTEGARLAPYETWPLVRDEEVLGYRVFSTGKDGLLVHPHMFDERVLEDAFEELCPSRSDAWINGALLAGRTPTLNLSTSRVLPDETLPRGGDDGRFPDLLREETAPTEANTLTFHNKRTDDEYIRRTFEHFGVTSMLTGEK
jgi:hypothetical protein